MNKPTMVEAGAAVIEAADAWEKAGMVDRLANWPGPSREARQAATVLQDAVIAWRGAKRRESPAPEAELSLSSR